MGGCFSKKSTSSTTPIPQQPEFKPDFKSEPPQQQQHVLKKEIFVIKHRISHEIDRHSNQDNNDQNPSPKVSGKVSGDRTRTSSCSKDEVDAILIQCGRLSRSNSAGAQNPNLRTRRRYSRSKRSFDFNLSSRLKHANDYDDMNDNDNDKDKDNDEIDGLHHWHREVRVSSPCSRRNSRSSSKERRISISPSRRSQSPFRNSNTVTATGGGGSSKERRISISPSKRSQSPFCNLNAVTTNGGGSSNNNRLPAKMVSVPATNKSNVAGGDDVAVGVVKRIHVKRNVSPAKTNLQVFTDNHSQELRQNREYYNTREADEMYYRRRSLVEIDNNAARSSQPKRTRKLSRDLDVDPDPSPPSYASLLLEDINKFHQKNASGGTRVSPDFVLPECVSKACSIMEAVADLNSNTSSLCSDDRWRHATPIKKERSAESGNVVSDVSLAAVKEPESPGSNGVGGPQESSKLGGFQRDFMEYPRKGIGRGRKTPYLTSNSKTVALT